MRRFLSSLLIISSLSLGACSSAEKSSEESGGQDKSASESQHDSSTAIGTWKQVDSASDDGWMEASTTDDVVTVEWVFNNGEKRMVFWIGSFDSAKAAAGNTVASQRDSVATDTELMASTDDQKDFTVKNDTLSFKVSFDDADFTAELKKIKDEPATVNTLKSTDSTRSFENGVLEMPGTTIKINQHKIIPAGGAGNEAGEKPLIVFNYEVTNKTEEKMTASDFPFYFTAVQDNNPDTVNELTVGGYYDPETSDDEFEEIKKGGTARGTIAYELDDESTPVQLVAKDNFGQKEVGRQSFDLEQ
ncbi:DUF5067 domain-containing protein [Corynebacterium sp. MSK105]|uniref:DUF5067 domain-containing protein n=1 Tax=unclassified Corynebacterium TaxID=2624378 RepID=UPI00254FE955|nr:MULTISPECIES: DUF5067 domain-containing protein [unclassified Corynebacterium]MDK8483680.1 DUF5067 domain-containing protein [Corynebacterium sp. MSK074]MDK8691108.1 DUF5067 domain-containing protein [Corynebacterium sp. MSK105]